MSKSRDEKIGIHLIVLKGGCVTRFVTLNNDNNRTLQKWFTSLVSDCSPNGTWRGKCLSRCLARRSSWMYRLTEAFASLVIWSP